MKSPFKGKRWTISPLRPKEKSNLLPICFSRVKEMCVLLRPTKNWDVRAKVSNRKHRNFTLRALEWRHFSPFALTHLLICRRKLKHANGEKIPPFWSRNRKKGAGDSRSFASRGSGLYCVCTPTGWAIGAQRGNATHVCNYDEHQANPILSYLPLNENKKKGTYCLWPPMQFSRFHFVWVRLVFAPNSREFSTSHACTVYSCQCFNQKGAACVGERSPCIPMEEKVWASFALPRNHPRRFYGTRTKACNRRNEEGEDLPFFARKEKNEILCRFLLRLFPPILLSFYATGEIND